MLSEIDQLLLHIVIQAQGPLDIPNRYNSLLAAPWSLVGRHLDSLDHWWLLFGIYQKLFMLIQYTEFALQTISCRAQTLCHRHTHTPPPRSDANLCTATTVGTRIICYRRLPLFMEDTQIVRSRNIVHNVVCMFRAPLIDGNDTLIVHRSRSRRHEYRSLKDGNRIQ